MKNNLRLKRNNGFRFELITLFHHSQIALQFCSFMILFCFLLFNGCRKKSPSDDPILQGNQALHAGAVAGYQALGAGISYPFMALQLASPTGSTVRDLSPEKSLLHSILGATIFKHNSYLSDLPEYQPYLNLYTSKSITGNVGTANYYTDAAGTKSAGSVTITMPTNITDISDPTSYASYPANITIVVNLTAGNLPCKGNISLSFTGGTGANTMKGTLTLTRVNVVFSLDLTLDNQMNTSGSVIITENGTTLEITNVKGIVDDPLACDVKISPYGWTGSGTLDLMTGEIKVNINTGTGTSTVTSDTLGNLNINYADGTHEIVIHALSAGLTEGGNPDGGSATYKAPLIYVSGQRTITSINNNGKLVGYLGYNEVPVYWATPTAKPDTLHGPTGCSLVTPNSINDNGQIVGSGYNGQSVALYWSSPTALPQVLALPKNAYWSEANSINNLGQIVGTIITSTKTSSGYVESTDALYWDNPKEAIPQVLQPLAGANGGAFFIAPNGQIIGRMDVLAAVPFWVRPKDSPVALSFLPGDSYANAKSVNASGIIVGYSGGGDQRPVTWAGATEAAKALPLLSGSVSGYAASINTAGVIVGSGGSNIWADGVIWQTDGQVQNLNTLIPSGNGYTLCSASLITNQGWILGNAANDNLSLMGQYILIPK